MRGRTSSQKSRPRHRAGRPSVAEAAGRIEKLLDVAAEVFLEKGFEGASVGEIVRRANASKQTLYSRYPTKAELFSAVMKRRSEAGFAILTDVGHSEKPLRDVLETYANILVFPLTDRDTLRFLRAIITTAETFPELAKSFWDMGPKRVYEMVPELLLDRMNKGELRKGDSAEAGHMFISMCTGRFWSQGLFGVRPRVTKAEVDEYVQSVVQSFLTIYSPAN
ncbi:MAG TPA: TetR/AcrR family transcriptional regulator [Candidatus Sulfotelmatobacter sp.]|nr:TetR/AcrR family transcriptional regulator [Candidatus Sulfotelmatobacter sp.]